MDKELYILVEKVADTFTKDTENNTLSLENQKAIDELVKFIKLNY